MLIVNKEAGFTSHDVVNKVRRLMNTRRVGHTGTLDPMATGVLVVLVGRAAKAAEYLSADTKRYTARLRLGLTSDTEDTTGTVLSECTTLPSSEQVLAAIPHFTGKIMQIPPMYSALKVGGKKLVDLARAGITVERQAREIEIFSLSCTSTDLPSDYMLDVVCSGGTYIRTLCADIGAYLGCGGVMASLERTRTGHFPIDEAHTLGELEAMTEQERASLLIPTEALFEDLAFLRLPSFYERLCRNGCPIYLKKLRMELPLGTRVRLLTEGGVFFALGEVEEHTDGLAVKAIKTFELL